MATREELIAYFEKMKKGPQAPPMPSSNFDLGISTSTPRMETTLPEATPPPVPPWNPEQKSNYNLSNPFPMGSPEAASFSGQMNPTPPQEPVVPAAPPVAPSAPPVDPGQTEANLLIDQALSRESEPKGPDWKGGVRSVGQAFAGLGDAISASGGRPTNTIQSAIKSSAAIDEKAKTADLSDPGSQTSNAYQKLLAKYTGKDPSTYASLSAERIAPLMKVAGDQFKSTTGRTNKPPAGYRWTASGDLESIPGGPKDETEDIETSKRKREMVLSQANNMLDRSNLAIKQLGKGILTAGESGRMAGSIPFLRQSRIDLENTVSTLKANQAFETLQKMREASKTGGALGQVSERELNLLQNALVSLDINQSDDLLRDNLMKVQEHWQRAIDAFNKMDQQGGNGRGPSNGGGPTIGAVEDGYRFKGGDPADQNNWEAN